MYKLSTFNTLWPIDNNNHVLYNSMSDTVLTLSNDLYTNLIESNWDKFSDENLSLFSNAYIVIPNDLTEKDIYEVERTNVNARKDTLGIFLVPSRACNLACTYCMQNNLFDKKDNMFITKDIVDRYYQWIQEKLTCWGSIKLNIIFYGGEPLTTNKNILSYIFQKFDELSVKPNYQMITNGVNLMEYLDVLKRIDNFQITLDGNKNIHDTRRIRKDGSGSYDEILHNIKSYLNISKNNTITLRMNVDKYNRNSLLDDVKEICSQLPMTQVTVSLNPVDPYEDSLLDTDIHGDMKDTAIAICKCYEYLQNTYAVDPKIWRLNCGISSLSQWSFDSDGSIYKCPALTGEPHRAVTNVFQSHMNSSFYKTMNRKLKNDECLSCCFFGLCYGSCPHQTDITHQLSCKKSFFDEYIPRMLELKYKIKNEVRT